MSKPKLLIIDDERSTREGLRRALEHKYEVATADDGERGFALILERSFDLVLTDLRMPGMNGLELIKRVKTMENPPVCVMLTAYESVANAVEAMKAGAQDFITKPVNLDAVELTLDRCLAQRRLTQENRELKRELAAKYAFEKLIGNSPPMQEIMDTIRQIAPARSTVMLSGESGTGKELAARAIHQLSNRADRPFVTVHCAALARTLLETELFGHEKNAFTGAGERRLGRFETADGGTVFLDEIGEIDPSIQVTLLRFLENRSFERVGGNEALTVDVRLIAATNRDLKALVAQGKFREDLYYRLDVLHLHLPALRERRSDIPLLLMHYLELFNGENGKQIAAFTPDAVSALVAYDWPGNVRELRNAVERMVVLARGTTITVKDLPAEVRAAAARDRDVAAAVAASPLDLGAHERELVSKALRECAGNRTAAAVKLGISRRTMHRKLKEYHLEDEGRPATPPAPSAEGPTP